MAAVIKYALKELKTPLLSNLPETDTFIGAELGEQVRKDNSQLIFVMLTL